MPTYFLPGLMCDQRLWFDTWAELSADSTPIAVKFGKHDNINDMLNDVTTHLGMQPVDMVGFSMGGYLALQYALKYPDAIKSLVIIGASATGLGYIADVG